MTIPFFWPTIGGILIGLSATLLLLSIGKVAGIAGIFWGAMRNEKHENLWRWLFLAGMIGGTALLHMLTGKAYPPAPGNLILAMVAGLFVGFGVRLGNGCTSGHGVCGIGRLSVRSLMATGTFMLVAIITVFCFNAIRGL
jgi:uncharacterized membrane protein YedE/YeeE